MIAQLETLIEDQGPSSTKRKTDVIGQIRQKVVKRYEFSNPVHSLHPFLSKV